MSAEQLEAKLLIARARSAWDAAKRDDDEHMREASEIRLTRDWPKPRMAPARAFVFGAAAAFAVAAVLFLVFGRSRAPASAPSAAAAVAPAASIAPPPPSTTSAAPRPVADAPLEHKPSRVVATTACRECKLEAGAVVGDRVVVPAGARLSLGFAFDDGLVDPASGVDLVGPATAASGADATVTIERGLVRVRAPRNVVVNFPGGKVTASNAIYTVRIDDRGIARIDVEKGKVAVLKHDASSEVVVPAGGATYELALAIEGEHARPTAPAPVTASVLPSATSATGSDLAATALADSRPQGREVAEQMLNDARVKARQGDASARADLEKLASSKDARVARRASFTLAELELASGAKDKARARLDELVTCPEASLGADASTLLARSQGSAADRAEVWRRYLATNPPSPYLERATLERAEALIDSGRAAEAKRLLDDVRRSPRLTDAQQKQLDRLTVKVR